MQGRLLCLLVSFLVVVAANSCFDAWEPTENPMMGACCWYESDTCCTVESGFTPRLANVSDHLYNNVTDNGVYSSFDLDQCFTYYENFFCSICSPDQYVTTAPVLTLTICEDFCNDWYNTCGAVPEFGSRYAMYNITSGRELCEHIPEAALRYENEVLNRSSTVVPFVISVASTNCYGGVSSDIIGNSLCTPWEGDYVDPNAGESTKKTTDGDPEDTEGNSSGYYWIFLVIGLGFVFLIVGAIVALVGFFLYKRKQAANVTGAAASYPDLDELDDFE